MPNIVNRASAVQPQTFKQATASALGSTAVWTPGTGNKFRLLKYRIMVSADSYLASAGELTISLLDAAASIAISYVIALAGAAPSGTGAIYDTGWVDLGTFGITSSAANNVLNVNLGTALAGGKINVLVAGVEV